MSREAEEWARAAQAGRAATRRKLLRVVIVVALALAGAGALGAALWWQSYGSRKKAGESCARFQDCASGTTCFDYECTPTCQSDVRCDPGRTCVEVPVASVDAYGRSGGGAGFRNLCVHEAAAPRYKAMRDRMFQR